ncbi:polypeptide N-acetylgalactosaminyltransferase activity [Sparganum proliferum]
MASISSDEDNGRRKSTRQRRNPFAKPYWELGEPPMSPALQLCPVVHPFKNTWCIHFNMRTIFFRRDRIKKIALCVCLLSAIYITVHIFWAPIPVDLPQQVPILPGQKVQKDHQEDPLLVIDHRGPHQPDAVRKHFDAHKDDGDLKNNQQQAGGGAVQDPAAAAAQIAIDSIHKAAMEHEQDKPVFLPAPDVDVQKMGQKVVDEAADDTPPGLHPLTPPNQSGPSATGPGEHGKAVKIDKDALSPEERVKYDTGEQNNAFNEYASNMISVRRYLPDIRDARCKDLQYTQKHSPASIIICFHNEAWSVLLRSVHSILDRSPEHLVKEIILVDDASTMDHLKKPLERYMKQLGKVKIVRADTRQGLIRARMLGAKASVGSVLIFLDSHIECIEGWLVPLLDRIAEKSTNVVVPVIDVISSETLHYSHSSAENIQVGGFDWGLQFRWHTMPKNDANRPGAPVSPVRTPTMAGGLFAIDRGFFERLGWYDPGYEVWGAENLELSFKTWMCGGQLETIPCSHVGHIFRTRSPYSWRVNQTNPLRHNLLRLAEALLDDYKYFYFARVNFQTRSLHPQQSIFPTQPPTHTASIIDYLLPA